MKYLVEKDKRRRFLFEKNEKKILCFVLFGKKLPFSVKDYFINLN